MQPGDTLRLKQLPLRLGAGAAQGFDNFIVGANEAALGALRASCDPSSRPSGSVVSAPIYLWGVAGAGKTHLLEASRRASQAAGGHPLAFTADRPLPWAWDEACTLLVLDGCDAYDADRQHAAFALFVEAATAQVPVVAAGRLPPVDLPVREDLRTRLGWGLVFQVQPASEAEARLALRQQAHSRGVPLSDEVVDYLFNHFERDLGSLMAWLDALDDFSLSEKRSVTVPLLKRMLAPEAAAAPSASSAPSAPLATEPSPRPA